MINPALGKNLKILAYSADHTATTFCAAMGVHYDSIMKWFRGAPFPPQSRHAKIAEILDCDVADLLMIPKGGEHQLERIERLLTRIDKLLERNDRLEAENERLKSQVANPLTRTGKTRKD